jgi:hypothetical protein
MVLKQYETWYLVLKEDMNSKYTFENNVQKKISEFNAYDFNC